MVIVRLARGGGMLSTLNVTRPRHAGRFEPSGLEVARRLHPHLIRAFNLSASSPSLGAFAERPGRGARRLVHGVLLLDDAGRVRHANAVAERLLRRPAGSRVVCGRLSAAQSDSARRLDALIGQAGGRRRGDAASAVRWRCRRRRGALPLSLTVAPLRPGRLPAAGAPAVLVCVTDLEAGVSLPQQRLRDLFGLTPAETRLALAMFEGLAPREAAERFGISPHTVHAQLARIFEKTGAKRQAELVRLMMRVSGLNLGAG